VSAVHDAELALDLAVVSFYAEGARAAKRWCDHAEVITDTVSTRTSDVQANELQLRLHARRCAIALVEADLETAFVHVEQYRRLLPGIGVTDSFEVQFPILASRLMLALRRRADVEFWIGKARRIRGPEVVTAVTVPTLRAWQAWLFGDLQAAVTLSDGALAWMRQHGGSANHLTFDTLITAAWCRIGVGDLDGASELSQLATAHADDLGYAWQRLQAGYVAAQLAVYRHEQGQALKIIDDLRSEIPFETCRPYSDRIVAVELEARTSDPVVIARDSELANTSVLGPRAQLLLAARAGPDDAIDEMLADRAQWIVSDRVQAELLLLTRRDDHVARHDLEQLVGTCAEKGWVQPFFGINDSCTDRLLSLPLDELHPGLARLLKSHVASVTGPEPPIRDGVLTAREASLLPLLETYMSYAEMGERLYLSVNTVKSNLQRLYRKLGARTRREAVDAARQLGLLQSRDV
jgi:DNA-binding NarL/FixJ family response regulator